MGKKYFLYGIVLLSGLVDAPSYVSAGAISLMGILTILIAVGIAFFLIRRPRLAWHGFLRVWPLSCLLLFSILQCFLYPVSAQEFQNVSLLWVFVGLIVLAMTAQEGRPSSDGVARMLLRVSVIAAICYALVVLYAGFGPEGIGASSFIAARSFALYALLGIGLLLGRWAQGSRKSVWLAAALVLLIALSLSRTATIAGLLLFPFSRMRSISFRNLARVVVIGGMGASLLLFSVVHFTALRSRFLGNYSIEDYILGDASVDTSGRLTAWAITLDSYIESPWFGKGPGSANNLIDQRLYQLDLGHPLNEYLRFLHDSGVFGLAFLLVGCVELVVQCRRAYRNAMAKGLALADVYLGTELALIAVLLSMITDNAASYLFVMGPLAILIGTTLRSLGSGTRQAKDCAAARSISLSNFSRGMQQ